MRAFQRDTAFKSSGLGAREESGWVCARLGEAGELQTLWERDKKWNEGAGTAEAACLFPQMAEVWGSDAGELIRARRPWEW